MNGSTATELVATAPTPAQRWTGVGWHRWSWALFGVFTVHQAEEVLAANWAAPTSAGPRPLFAVSDVDEFSGFVSVLMLVQLAQMVLATTGPFRVWKPWIVAAMATSMLLNVLVPHIPGAIAAGGYHPGVVTAIVLFIPCSLGYLRYLHRNGLISTRGILVCFGISLGILVASVASLAAA